MGVFLAQRESRLRLRALSRARTSIAPMAADSGVGTLVAGGDVAGVAPV
jgi:hypothetical protein